MLSSDSLQGAALRASILAADLHKQEKFRPTAPCAGVNDRSCYGITDRGGSIGADLISQES
jgi:hypothetical protein